MKVTTTQRGSMTAKDVAEAVRVLSREVASGWVVDHRTDGTHRFPWSVITYTSTQFTGGGSQTWTVAAGDVLTAKWRLIDDTLTLQLRVVDTTVGGTANPVLRYKLPNSLVASGNSCGSCAVTTAAGTSSPGVWFTEDGTDYVQFWNSPEGGNWTGVTDEACVAASMEIQVQR